MRVYVGWGMGRGGGSCAARAPASSATVTAVVVACGGTVATRSCSMVAYLHLRVPISVVPRRRYVLPFRPCLPAEVWRSLTFVYALPQFLLFFVFKKGFYLSFDLY